QGKPDYSTAHSPDNRATGKHSSTSPRLSDWPADAVDLRAARLSPVMTCRQRVGASGGSGSSVSRHQCPGCQAEPGNFEPSVFEPLRGSMNFCVASSANRGTIESAHFQSATRAK